MIPQRVRELIDRVDELTLRERSIVLGGILTLLFLGWYVYFMEPLAKQEKALLAELETKRGQLQTLNEQFELLAGMQRRDPNEASRKKLAELREEEARLQEELQGATAHLVAPESMPDILRQVLKSAEGLRLVSLQGLGSAPLLKADGASQAAPDAQPAADAAPAETLEGAFKHGMQIQVSGDFFSTLEYMRDLENLEWAFFWDSITFAVDEYPGATASIRFFTLSLNSNWIGT